MGKREHTNGRKSLMHAKPYSTTHLKPMAIFMYRSMYRRLSSIHEHASPSSPYNFTFQCSRLVDEEFKCLHGLRIRVFRKAHIRTLLEKLCCGL